MGLQLTLDAADRLDALVGDAGGAIHFRDAAKVLVRAARVPDVVARRLVDEVVRADARLSWRSADEVARRGATPGRPLEEAAFCVFDLETTGMRPTADRIVEIGAVRVVALETVGGFERLVDPGVPIPAAVRRLTGIDDRAVRGRGPLGPALDAFVRFAGDACLVAHNARFDVGFLDAALARRHGRRSAAPVVDTVGLARALLPARRGRFSLAALADRFDTSVTPCHRALPDAQATAELLLALVGLAQERGAETVDDLVRLCRPPARRAHDKRVLAAAAPRAPGTYVMRDATGRALYVGTAGDLRRRTQGYFRGGPQPRGVERALAVVERLDYAEAGSAFEARLDEIGLILGLRPTANRRGVRPERSTFLRLSGTVARLSVSATGTLPPTEGGALPGLDVPDVRVGPLGARGDVERVAAALRLAYGLRSCRSARPVEGSCLEGRLGRCIAPCRGGEAVAAHEAAAETVRRVLVAGGTVPVERLRERRRKLAAMLRFEEAATVRDLEAALRRAGGTLAALRTARTRHGVVLAPHRDRRLVAAFAVAGGLVVERRGMPRGGGAALEVSALVAALRRVTAARDFPPDGEEAARRHDELLHVDATFRRPPAGLVVVALGHEQLRDGRDADLAARIIDAGARVPPRGESAGAPSRHGLGPAPDRAGGRPAGASSDDRALRLLELPT